MEKMTSNELNQLQLLPLDIKIKKSKLRIKEWYDAWDGKVYVSFSGGKDSTVLKHLVENTVGVYDVPSVFCDTGLEYPEVRNFALSQQNVLRLKPKMTFKEVIDKYGYPVVSKNVANTIRLAKNQSYDSYRNKQLRGEIFLKNGKKSMFNCENWSYLLDAPFKISEQCCNIMKKNPLKKYEKESNRKPFIGTMASESIQRRTQYLKQGCNSFDAKRVNSTPIAFWTEQDILEYIIKYDLNYASVYGKIEQDENGKYYTSGVKRTGCMFCMFGLTQEKEPNRFQQMKLSHPNIYNYCMKKVENGGLGLSDVLDYLNTSTSPRFKKINYK